MRNLTLALSPLIASSLTTAGQAQVMQSGPKNPPARVVGKFVGLPGARA